MSREPGNEEHFAPPVPNAPWKAAQALCRVSTTLCFDLKVYGWEQVPRTGGVLLLSNHQSFLDPVLVGVRLPRPLSYMAKSELFEVNPAFTWIIRKLGAFPVRQTGSAAGALKTAIGRLKDGHALNIFPEGSRTEDGEIGPIEGGAALVVRGAKVPVVPVVIDGSFEAWPRAFKLPRPHPIQVLYGPPADLAGRRPAEIVTWVDHTLRALYDELRSRRPSGVRW
jgi:1-acyl-sn-glycerol-3-phosphate acyltransferase